MTARAIGILTADPAPLLLDHLTISGIDFVVLDAEQTGLAPPACAAAVRQLAGSATSAYIRVPDLTAATLVSFANTGAGELVLPQVRSLSEVDQAWKAVHYPPAGTRPRQPSPASRFGSDWSNAPVLSIIIETVEAVELAGALARSEQIVGAWIGLTDLRQDLADHGRESELDDAVAEILAQFAAAAAPVGLPAAGPQAARAAFDRGAARCLVYWESYLHEVLGSLRAATTDPGLTPAAPSAG
jgi:2-keto-3-deoxy-L-rhamnonate aldolase RhmA